MAMNQQTAIPKGLGGLALVAVAGCFLAAASGCAQTGRPCGLRTEYRVNPLGIDAMPPRLSWAIDDPRRGAVQTAWQVLVASTLENLSADKGDLWDSGKVASDQSHLVAYAGRPLASQTCCYWKVRTWDADGQPSAWSEPATGRVNGSAATSHLALIPAPRRRSGRRTGSGSRRAIRPPRHRWGRDTFFAL